MQLRQCIYGSASDGLALVFQASEKAPSVPRNAPELKLIVPVVWNLLL